jgi:hypothetical protein
VPVDGDPVDEVPVDEVPVDEAPVDGAVAAMESEEELVAEDTIGDLENAVRWTVWVLTGYCSQPQE